MLMFRDHAPYFHRPSESTVQDCVHKSCPAQNEDYLRQSWIYKAISTPRQSLSRLYAHQTAPTKNQRHRWGWKLKLHQTLVTDNPGID